MFSLFLSPEDRAALQRPRGYRTPFSLPTKSPEATNLMMFEMVTECLEGGPLHILDIGCGSGALLQRIADYYRTQGWDPDEYLLGTDMDEDFFQANVPFQASELTKPLNFQMRSFDLVIAMEVLEHVRSPYTLLQEIYATLHPGGKLLFSVPNMMTIVSRLRFLLTGRFRHYDGPSSDPADADSGMGHINPFPIQYWDYGFRYAGFADIRYRTDRIKRGALCLAVFLGPLMWLGKYWLHKQEHNRNSRVYQQNFAPFCEINSLRNLAGHGLVAICTKPSDLISEK